MRRLVQLRAVTLDSTARRLGGCYDVSDLRRAAKRRIPRPVFDYVDGAADEEIASAANTAAFRSWRFLPRVLAGVASAETAAPVFGSTLPVPMLLGPAGYTRMMHPDGEIGAARSALRHGIPYTLSTMASTGIEELRAGVAGAASGGDGDLWFQLYLTKNRPQAFDLVSRAADNGFSTLVVTVDTIVAGNRVRDLRNGLSIPPALTLSTVASVAIKPSYWYHLLAGPALDYANFAGRAPTTVMKTADFFDADLNWTDISDLRSRWAGKLLLKGPVGPADARRALELGVDPCGGDATPRRWPRARPPGRGGSTGLGGGPRCGGSTAARRSCPAAPAPGPGSAGTAGCTCRSCPRPSGGSGRGCRSGRGGPRGARP